MKLPQGSGFPNCLLNILREVAFINRSEIRRVEPELNLGIAGEQGQAQMAVLVLPKAQLLDRWRWLPCHASDLLAGLCCRSSRFWQHSLLPGLGSIPGETLPGPKQNWH